MNVSAVAEVLEHMRGVDEWRDPEPGGALATHLRQQRGPAVGHPQPQRVAADAGDRHTAVGHARGNGMRAAGAEMRDTDLAGRAPDFLLRPGDCVEPLSHGLRRRQASEPLAKRQRNDVRRQFAAFRQQGGAAFVALADDARPPVGRPVIGKVLDLRFENGAALLDHHDLLGAVERVAQAFRFERPHQADFIYDDAEAGGERLVDAELRQGLAHVAIGLAGGNDRQAAGGAVAEGDAIKGIGAGKRLGRRQSKIQLARILAPAVVRPAGAEPLRRKLEIIRQQDGRLLGIDRDGCRALDRIGHGFHAGPGPSIARHGDADEAEAQDLADILRTEHGNAGGDEGLIALVGQRGRTRARIVAGYRENPAMRRGADGIAVLDRIAGAVEAGVLAVPDAEHAVELAASDGGNLLRAADRGRGEFFIEARSEFDVV